MRIARPGLILRPHDIDMRKQQQRLFFSRPFQASHDTLPPGRKIDDFIRDILGLQTFRHEFHDSSFVARGLGSIRLNHLAKHLPEGVKLGRVTLGGESVERKKL